MKNKNARLYPLLSFILLTMACTSDEPNETERPTNADFVMPYRLQAPDTTFSLAVELREVSGLAVSGDGAHLLAVNDEQGLIFYLNPNTGAVERTRTFGGAGDYEGVEVVGDDVFVVKSNGDIVRIPESGEPETWPTPLDGDFNVEGLCYDSVQHRLLLACKGIAGRGEAFTGKKAVYAFDLNTRKMNETPAFLINQSELAHLKGSETGLWARLLDFFSSESSASAFGPSGLAVNPLDSNLYIVSFVGRVLAVVHPDGRLLYAERLKPGLFKQPEGLCFDLQGRLYIASEGRKRKGKVLRFEPAR